MKKYGAEPSQWEIYRGDSFQLEVAPVQALRATILIKATIKQFNEIDVRMAIGIGEKSYTSNRISKSNGSAFVNSGDCFEQLKTRTLAIKSPWHEFDEQMNLLIELVLLTMNNWTPISSLIIKTALENLEHNQKELSKILKKGQSNISAGLKRGGYNEIIKMNDYYEKKITLIC